MFKVGQRVRIVCLASEFHNDEAIISEILNNPPWTPEAITKLKPSSTEPAYCVDVKGKKTRWSTVLYSLYVVGFPKKCLRPILGSWDELTEFAGVDIKISHAVTA